MYLEIVKVDNTAVLRNTLGKVQMGLLQAIYCFADDLELVLDSSLRTRIAGVSIETHTLREVHDVRAGFFDIEQ